MAQEPKAVNQFCLPCLLPVELVHIIIGVVFAIYAIRMSKTIILNTIGW